MPKSRGRKRKKVKMAPAVSTALKGQLNEFIKKFGREPRPGEPVFFDPDADEPRPLDLARVQADVVALLEEGDVSPEIILLLTEMN